VTRSLLTPPPSHAAVTRSLPTSSPISNGLILDGPLFILDVISLSLSPSHSQFPDGVEERVVIVDNSAMIVVRGLDSSPSPSCLSRHLDPLPIPRFIHPYSLGAPDPPIHGMSADFPAISNTSSTPPTTYSRPTLLILRHIQLGSCLPTSSRIPRDLGSDLDIIHPASIKPVCNSNMITLPSFLLPTSPIRSIIREFEDGVLSGSWFQSRSCCHISDFGRVHDSDLIR